MLLKSLLDILFPPLCHVCKTFIPDAGGLHVCPRCLDDMGTITSPLCTLCGIPFATENGSDHHCGDCITAPPPYDAARAAGVFNGPLKELIHRFKYDHKVHLRRPLGLYTARSLAAFAAECRADLILPVPLHKKRLAQRAFNQAVLLGEVLSQEWHISLDRNNLRRTRWTAPQVGLPAQDRARNVRGAFEVHNPEAIKGKRVILIDDVFTTGSTVAECARVIRGAGGAAVFVVTVARAV